MMFLGYTQAYERHQSPLILREALLVAFFLAGLVLLGSMQRWWLQPIVSGLEPLALFFGALGLTAITDNAALTYLGSLLAGMSDSVEVHARRGCRRGRRPDGRRQRAESGRNRLAEARLCRWLDRRGLPAIGAALPTAVAAAAFLLL